MTEAVRTVRNSDQRPRWHYRYQHDDSRFYRRDAADVIHIQMLQQVEHTPEALLTVKIIAQAVEDTLNPAWNIPQYQYHDAFRFFRDGRLDSLCDLVDLEADWVRRLIAEAVGGELKGPGAQ